MELPTHPRDDRAAPEQQQAATGSRGTALFIAIVAVLFVVMIVLHLSGTVGPGAH